MDIDIIGLCMVVTFYILILVVGIVAAKKFKYQPHQQNESGDGQEGSKFIDHSLVAGRDIGLVVGIFTMSATSVGGGFLSGTAEGAATIGLLWTVFPLAILLGLTLGGLIFAGPMRQRQYVTMLDPLQDAYGDFMTGMILLAALLAEVMWGATILLSLGTNLSVIIGLNVDVAIIGSSVVACVYTLFGQMISVAYTDVLQFGFVVIGMVLCIPFIYTNEKIGDIGATSDTWIGSIEGDMAFVWCDFFIAQTLGSIPWNTYFMRVLSVRNVSSARSLSIWAGVISLVMAVPPFLIGTASTAADWNSTDYGTDPAITDSARLLPLVIDSFTPRSVSLIALAAIAAAVMSSIDSIILSSSSMFTRNIYQMAFRPSASEKELRVAHMIAMLAVTTSCLLLAIFSDTIYGIFILTADILYVTVFPQLVCAVFLTFVNPLGSLVGYLVSTFLRFGGGESTLNIDPLIKFPYHDDTQGQLFPFRTFSMLCGIVCIIGVSWVTNCLSQRYDWLDRWITVKKTERAIAIDKKDLCLPSRNRKNRSETKCDKSGVEILIESRF